MVGDIDQVLATLETLTGASMSPTITPQQLIEFLDQARVEDTQGRFITDEGYVTTWNVDYAAALVMEAKAAAVMAGTVTSWSSEGTSVSRTGGATWRDFLDRAEAFKRKAFGQVHVIELGDSVTRAPRSAYWGVTDDDVDRYRD